MQPAILPAEIEQRIAPRVELRPLHFAHQNEVIAAFVNRMAAAFERAERPGQYRGTVFAFAPVRCGKAIFTLAGKTIGHRLLPDLQDIDREVFCLLQDRTAAGGVRDTYEQQRRIE